MPAIFPDPNVSIATAVRGKAMGGVGAHSTYFSRLPTDPLFFANLTLENIVVGSRYRVTRASNGDELATGEAANTTVTLTGIAVYSNPMLVKIAVRKGTTAPKYIPLDAYASMTRGTATAYISQVPDPIA